MNRKGFLITVLLTFLSAVPAEAALVQALVDRNQAAVGESVSLRVSIKDGQGEVEVPDIKHFRIFGNGTSNSIQIINGKTLREQIHQYTLIPLEPGTFTIPPLRVTIDGATTRTQPISITVTRRPVSDSTSNDLFVTGEISDSSPFVGQQVVYTFRFYKAAQVLETRLEPPAFRGFDAKRIDEQNTYTETRNGRRYAVVELTYILIPDAPGKIDIDPAILHCSIAKERRRRSAFPDFDSFFNPTETEIRRLVTDPLSIQVRPLPEPAPGNRFSGLVGTFDIESNLETDKIKAGESTTLSVTVRGAGNVMDAQRPQIDMPSAFKSYPDNPEEKVTVGKSGYEGEKIFRSALVALSPGSFRISPVSLTYFDVGSGSYRTKMTAPLELQVTASETAGKTPEMLAAPKPNEPPRKNRVEFTGRDILPLKEEIGALSPARRLSLPAFAGLLVLPAIVFLVAIMFLRLSSDDTRPVTIMRRRSKAALTTAEKTKADPAESLSWLYKALVYAVFARSGRMGESLTRQETERMLTDNGWDPSAAGNAASFIERIESFNYSGEPLDEVRRTDLHEQTQALVKRLLP